LQYRVREAPSQFVCEPHHAPFAVRTVIAMPVDLIHLLIGIMFAMVCALACRIFSTQR